MHVREASLDDRELWDQFVDQEGGSFYQYFDWKYIYEARGLQYIPLIVCDSSAQITGILPIVKEKHLLYSTLRSTITGKIEVGGLFLNQSLTVEDTDEALDSLLEYIDKNFGNKCSSIKIILYDLSIKEEPNRIFINKGYRYCFDKITYLPGDFILELQQPFEENIWRKLWSGNLRNQVNRAMRNEVVVIEDYDFKYVEDFVLMLTENCKRHGTESPSRNEILTRIKLFRDTTKLFVAIKDNHPIFALLCHYTPTTCYISRAGSWVRDTDEVDKLCYRVVIEDACNLAYISVDFGCAYNQNLAHYKEKYRAKRIPVKLYSKVFSLPKYLMEVGPDLIKNIWQDKSYLIKYKRKIWDILSHR